MSTPDLGIQIEALFRLLVAGVLAAIVGYERETAGRPAGLRTYILVSLGACLFTLVSILGFPGSDPSRVAAQIVTGIGFIGAGSIIVGRAGVSGITTAAGVWAIAAVGMASATGLYVLAVATAVGAYLVLEFVRIKRVGPPPEPPEEA
jgi:putative Mg2+ transporter-C (MgtC) family protein